MWPAGEILCRSSFVRRAIFSLREFPRAVLHEDDHEDSRREDGMEDSSIQNGLAL
jgi:hypothetical protein